MTQRIACCVPFCTRTRGDRKGDPVARYSEWICGKHWAAVRRDLKRILARRRRTLFKQGEGYRSHYDHFWQICKRDAIERGVGL